VDFRVKSNEILTRTILSHVDRKQQQMDQKLCGQGLWAKPSHPGLVCNVACFGGSCA